MEQQVNHNGIPIYPNKLKTCGKCQKTIYRSKEHATRHILKHSINLYWYKCPHGHGVHITHLRQKGQG